MTRKFHTFSENLSVFGGKKKECQRFSNYYQKNKMPKILQCGLHWEANGTGIDVPSALIANCAQPFFPRQSSLWNLILRNLTPFLSDCVLQF